MERNYRRLLTELHDGVDVVDGDDDVREAGGRMGLPLYSGKPFAPLFACMAAFEPALSAACAKRGENSFAASTAANVFAPRFMSNDEIYVFCFDSPAEAHNITP